MPTWNEMLRGFEQPDQSEDQEDGADAVLGIPEAEGSPDRDEGRKAL